MSNLIRYYNPLDRAFDRALGVLLPSVNADTGATGRAIALDVVETPEAYIVKAELPGIAKDKIEVNVEDRDVTIGAEFLDEVEASGKTLWKERTFSKASRSIRLPEAVDANRPVALPVQRHIESCLRCQAELARYRRMLRSLQLLRTQFLEPAPGLLASTLAAIEEASERRAIQSVLTGRRIAYAGAIGGALAAAGATAAAVLVHRARRRAAIAH
jgi:HSP20 family protein